MVATWNGMDLYSRTDFFSVKCKEDCLPGSAGVSPALCMSDLPDTRYSKRAGETPALPGLFSRSGGVYERLA